MKVKEIFKQLNIIGHCRRYGLSPWQCPQFLFLVMGLMVCLISIASFMVGTRFVADPAAVALIVLAATAVLIVISFLVIRSFERLAEANRMKSEFVGVVSHQLRGPLTNLSWALEPLSLGKLGEVEEEQVEYFNILKENIARMKELVSDLIIVSRIETADLPLKKQAFSLVEQVEKLVDEYRLIARALNVKIELEAEENLPQVMGDVNQTRQAIENLLDNAIRYIHGGGDVRVKLTKKGNEVYIEIKDTGVGIPEEDQKYIFQRFFRTENVLRHQTQGSGLGLFIAKSIIKRSGGKIGFKSKEGKGTTFWFTLPIKS